MGIFSSKSKDKDMEVNFMMVDGIPGIGKGTAVAVGIKDSLLTIRMRLSKEDPYTLQLAKITNVTVLSEKEIIEKQKSVAGRAVVGGVLLGPLGAIIGGMSGIGNKKKSDTHYYMIINYVSNDDKKALSFEIVGASIGWTKLVDTIRAHIPNTENKEL